MTEDLMVYTQQLAVMMGVGVPIDQALAFVARGTNRDLNAAFERCSVQVSRGKILSQALAEHPQHFPAIYIGLVAAAERSGALVQVLRRLAQYLEKRSKLNKQLVSSLTYPAVLMLVCGLLLAILLLFVVPAMQPMFAQLGVSLPWLTRAVLALVGWLRNPTGILAFFLVVTFLGVLIHQLLEAEPDSELRTWLDHRVLRIPFVGNLVRLTIASRICDTFGLMLNAGVGVDRALPQIAVVAGNQWYRERLELVLEDVMNGNSLSASFSAHRVLPGMAIALIRNAEEVGRLGETLGRVGQLLDEQVEMATQTMASLAEPIVLGLTSAVIGIVSIATLLPWIQLLQDLF